jgi:hypothetical protein
MDWLMSEIFSNYLIFILGLIVGLITEVVRARLQKQKPSIIQVEKERDTSLISISPDVRVPKYKENNVWSKFLFLFRPRIKQDPINRYKAKCLQLEMRSAS